MTPGIKFHRGEKQIKLGKADINDAVEFPDDFEFSSSKAEKKFLKNFTDDVTRFHDKVTPSTSKIYDAATREIATWILKSTSGNPNKQKTLSVFSPDEPIGNLRTALVQCNFTDVSRLIKDFRSKIMEEIDDDRVISEMVVTENDAIHEIIDKIADKSSSPNTLCVIMIRQFESLRPQFLDSLVTLLYSDATCRAIVPRVRLVICVSTSPTFFTQNCGIETMNMLKLKNFQFTNLEEIFSKIVSTGIHAHFQPPRPKPKKIEEDDPNLINSFDCAPAVFSGPFMVYLKNRFFACDHSISALQRAIQFALLQKYLEDPLWRQETHEEELKKYDSVLRLFLDEFGEQSEHEFFQIHMEVQSDPEFWAKVREKAPFREKKQFLFEGMSKENLLKFCNRILDKMDDVDDKFCEKLEVLMQKLKVAKIEQPVAAAETPVKNEKAPAKMKLAELQKQARLALSAKQNTPIATAKSAIFGHVMSLFETILKPYPATWRNVIGASSWNKDRIKTSLDSSDEYDIENCLLHVKNHSEMPISIAWRSLLCHRNFKTVSIMEWADEFLKHIKMPRSEAKGAFFAAAGQLEHIGLIRGSADRKSTNVNVLYHPISFIPLI